MAVRMARRSLLVLLLATAPALRAGEVVENREHTGPKTTITYAMWGGANEVGYSRTICEAFVKKHPDIRVSVAVFPWGQYWAKLQTQAASGLAPDVISLYSGSMGVWIARGALLPLDGLVQKSGLNLDDYHRAAVEHCVWGGTLYCMPLEIPIRTLVYSVDRLEERGIPRAEWPRPDRAMSWQAFKRLAARLTLRRPDGSFDQYGLAAGIDWNKALLRQFGGRVLDRQVDPTASAVAGSDELLRGLAEVFRTQYAERICLGEVPLASGAFASRDTLLLSPKFAMCTTGPWALKSLKEAGIRFGLAPLPRGPCPSQLIGLNSVGIYSGSPRAEAAWAFVRFMASAAVQPIFGRELKGVPALKAARDALIHNDHGIEGCEAFLHDLSVSAPLVTSSNTYVTAAVDKWLAQTERGLDREHDSRLRRLPRANGAIAPADYATFVREMDAFVETAIRVRLPALHEEIERAFARARRPEPSVATKLVLPVAMLAGLGVALAAYVLWLRRRARTATMARRETNLAGYLFISPWLVGFTCFVVGPIVAAVLLSFTEWNMIKAPVWMGAQNYADLLGDENFRVGLTRTFTYAALVIPISLCGGLFTAGLLTANVRGRDAFKAILYFPALFTGAAAAVLWVNMFNKEFGVVNRLLSFVGLAPVSWLDEGHAFTTVILMNVFWVGGAMIIYYAGMKQIPKALYEAAEIDGAGPVRKFTSITIPMLSPVILFMVVMTTIGAFQVFTPALFFASSSSRIGEPGDALRFYSVNIYDEAFNNLRMGRACGYAVLLFLIIFAVTMLQMRLSRRFVHTGEDA